MERRPKCKECKERFTPYNNNSLQKYCMQHDECIAAQLEYNKQQELKSWNKKKAVLAPTVHPKRFESYLDNEVQKLARMIDAKYGHVTCIDCGKPFGNQTDGGHRHSKGGNSSLRWNLHNIHSQKSDCNQNGLGGGRELGYHEGLISRYSQEYADYVRYDIVREYKYIGVKGQEVAEKLKIVRAIIRNFDKYIFKDSLHAREMCNKLIGIYTTYPYFRKNKDNE